MVTRRAYQSKLNLVFEEGLGRLRKTPFSCFPVLLILLVLAITGCTPAQESGPAVVAPTATAQPTLGAVVTATPIPPSSTPETVVSPTPPPATATPATRTVQPELLTGYIPNPYMGWQDTQPEEKRFAETVSYKRFNWKDINPGEGDYDWSLINSLRRRAVKQGSTFSFRIRTAQPPPWGDGQVMPAWLVERGAMIVEGGSDVAGVSGTEPVYSGCLFLEAHGQFIEALRQQYDGDPALAFIDIGSYGTYGEWDSEQYDDEPDSLDWHARRRIVDMYIGGKAIRPCQEADGQVKMAAYEYPGFQKTRLVMGYTPWFPDSLEYALSRSQTVGIRHDALGSEKHQNRYREEIGDLVAERWPYAPIVFEFYPSSYSREELQSARDFAREMHTSLVHDNFDGEGDDALIGELLATIGYRLVLREMTYTATARPGETVAFKMTWENTGSAPPYFLTYPLAVSLVSAQGIIAEQELNPDIRTWLPGQTIELAGAIELPAVTPGDYTLVVAFIDPVNRQPVLNLAIAGRDEQGRYEIGPVTISP